MSEEENCTLLCELPYYRSSVHELTHAINLNEENQPSGPSNGPRLSTAFSSPSQADSTNREAINISIEQRQEPSIVQPSSSKQSTPCGPRVVSDSSSLEDFTPLDSRHLQSGSQIALEVDEISEPEHGEPEPEQDSSFAHNLNPLINSQLTCHSQVRDRDSINYKKPKQNKTVKTKTRSDSVSSADSRYRETDSERRDSEDSEDEENKINNERETEADRENDDLRMDQSEIAEFQKQVMDFQRQMYRQLKDTQAAMENVAVPEPTLAKPTLFHGYENENVDRWLQRFTLYLANRKIRTDSSQAAIQLALHLSGPAESFYYNLSGPVQGSFDDLRNALKERFSPAHRSLRLRQALSIRRQGPSESIEKFLADLNEKFSCLDLRDEDKLSYLIQGLRPDIQAEVLKKEPKTYTEAEDTARLIYSIQQSLFQRREEDISRIVLKEKLSSPTASTAAQAASTDGKAVMTALEQLLQKKTAAKEEETVLAKLEALYNKDSQAPDAQHERLLLSKYSDLLEKTARRIADSPPREVNTTSLAAYTEPSKAPDCMREIRRMEDKLEELSRQIDARIKGLARRNSPNQVEQPRQRTREGRPICYTCGRVGHIQQNCNQRSSRETSSYDRFQPNQQRRPTNDNYPSRSGYNQAQRRNELPSFNPRNPRMAVLDEDYDDGFVAPLEQDTINQTIPEEGSNFLRIDWGNVGSQIGKELTQQLTNTSHMVPEVIQQNPVKKNQLPTVIIEVPKLRPESDQQTMEQNNESKVTCEATTADRSERKLPGNLETKPKSEVRQHLPTSPLDPSKSSGVQVNALPQSQEKLHLSGTAPFPNAVRRSKSRITADTDVIVDLGTEGIIERSSDPDPVQSRQSPSAGSESTAVNKDSLSNCMPDPIQTTGETPPLTAEQCNITNNQAKPRDLTVTAQLNGQDIKLLVDTGAGMSVIDEQFTRDVYKGELPKLEKSALANVKTVSGEELPVLGKIKVMLQIAGGKYPCDLQVVKNLTYEAVLGRDFLRANGAVINLRQGTLQLDDSPIDQVAADVSCPVRVLSTCVIPPSSEAVLPVGLDVEFAAGTVGLIETSQHLMDRYQLQGAAVLATTTADRTVPYRLINPTSKPVTLYKGANLGTFTSHSSNLQVFSLDTEVPEPGKTEASIPDVPVDFSNSALTESQQKQLQQLINEYRDVFALSPEELGRTNWVQHTIDTGDASPIRMRPYRVPEAQKERIEKCIDDMLDQEVIRPSASPWASPVVLVKKPDGSDRFCADFRRVNAITKKDSYPLPRIAESLDALAGTQYFSSMDLMSGYWQIEMDPESREKTAFITHAGLFEFNVMPFGLCNAPSCFQRLMECVLRGLNWRIALIYLDDVLVYSRTFDEHLQHLRLVFHRFREAGLKLKPKKCFFGQKNVKFLGHVISPEGVQPDPAKIKAIKEYPVPRKVKDVRAFLGLANYYRKFVKDFAKIAGPLHELTKKGLKFQWTNECQAAFDLLKTALTQAPILAYPDFTLPFDLYVDASDDALGMVLGQIQNGREVVIAYSGRKLLPAEKNYSVTEREALAAVAGVKYFQPYLYGRKFTIYTDHNAVRWLMNIREPTGRLARWALLLQQYDFEIVHRSGRSNGNADALSRREYDSVLAALDTSGVQTDRIKDLQRKDPALADIIEYLEFEDLPEDSKAAKKLLYTIEQYYLDPDGILCHIWIPGGKRVPTPRSQLVVPSSLRHEVLINAHDLPTGGHLGVNKTYAKLRDRYFWPKMYMDVQHWCLSCEHCAMKKSPKQRQTAPLLPIPVEAPFEKVSCDISGPWPVTHNNNRYILVFVDMCTKWTEAFAIPNIEAKTVAEIFVNEIVSRHGAPRVLLSDRGSNFLSSLFREVCFLMNTEKIFTSGYRPQTNGLVERFNGTLAQSLSMYVSSNQKDWDEHLNSVLFAYRVSPSEVTGESPFYMLYGREPLLPMDTALLPPREMSPSVAEHRARVVEHVERVRRIAAENTQRAQQKMKELHDLQAVPPPFALGDKVWVYTPKNRKGLSKKLAHNYHGPYRIVEFLSPVHCVLRAMDNRRVSTTVHVARMKRYVDPASRPIRHLPDDIDEPYLLDSDLPEDSFASAHTPSDDFPDQLPELIDCSDSDDNDDASCTEELDNEADKQDDIYTAEEIVKQRLRNGKPEYFIKWLGYPVSHNTWEPAENILDQRLITLFHKKHPRAKRLTADPDYVPGNVALLSWTESAASVATVAALTPGHERHVFRRNEPLTDPGRATKLAAAPTRTQVAVAHTDADKGLIPSFNPVLCPWPRSSTATFASAPSLGARCRFWLTAFLATRPWLLLLLTLTLVQAGNGNEYDATGREVSFYPNAMMLATNPKAVVFFRDTKLVSVHLNLPHVHKVDSTLINSTCDPGLAEFYDRVLMSIRGVQRATSRLLSIQGVTDLLECDSYLRRFYEYVTGSQSTLQCDRRHYANNLKDCKSWALRDCHATSPQEHAWLTSTNNRKRRSPWYCWAGLAGIPRFFYTLAGGHCDSPHYVGLTATLRDSARAMDTTQHLIRVINGKTVYLIKTTDMLNSKLNQVIHSLRLMAGAYSGWNARFTQYAKDQNCHFNLHHEFISLYTMEVNKALTSLLRLTEIDDLLRQLAHTSRKNLVSYADLPRFLTADLSIKLASVPVLANTLDALKEGFPLIVQPLIDYHLANSRNLQLQLLFTLPTLDQQSAICTMEQLIPLSYQINGKCFGGTMARHDLVLLTCGNKRYVLKQAELDQCFKDETTFLCPADVLSTVENPLWLGLKWTPQTKLSFRHAHSPLPNCNNLRPLVHLGGRYYLSTVFNNLSIHTNGSSELLMLRPFSIYHFPCNVWFSQQRTGLGQCPKQLSFQFPLFHDGQFQFVPWVSHPLQNNTAPSVPNFDIPTPLHLDNSTLQSLDTTYDTLDQDLTRRLQKVRQDIKDIHEVPHLGLFTMLVYLCLAFTICNFIVLVVFCRILFKRTSNSAPPIPPPHPVEAIPLTSQSTSTP